MSESSLHGSLGAQAEYQITESLIEKDMDTLSKLGWTGGLIIGLMML